MGIKPDFIIGHSIGELACAYADETLTLEQTVLITYWRGKSLLMSSLPKGAMAAIGKYKRWNFVNPSPFFLRNQDLE
jgi:fatty acid synthase